jgi:hypothetical protein
MKYFSNITQNHWKAKNKAEKQAGELALSKDHYLLIGESAKEKFIKEFEEDIASINKANPRCKDLVLQAWDPSGNSEKTIVYVSGVFQMGIVWVKKELS